MIYFSIDLSDYKVAIEKITTDKEKNLPNTIHEFNRFVAGAEDILRKYFEGKGNLLNTSSIPSEYRNSRAELLKSVDRETHGPLDVTIKASSPILDKIQKGQAESEFDMKTKYPFGKHSRVSKDKKGNIKSNYLIICFRWGASGDTAHFGNSIPTQIYRTQTSNMSLSWREPTTHPEANSRGEMIERHEYTWGDRVDDANAVAFEKSRVWKGKQMTTKITNAGMVRMGNDKGGSNFVTFRVISTKSPKDSWIRRRNAIEPIDIQKGFESTLQLLKPEWDRQIEKAVGLDVRNFVGNI